MPGESQRSMMTYDEITERWLSSDRGSIQKIKAVEMPECEINAPECLKQLKSISRNGIDGWGILTEEELVRRMNQQIKEAEVKKIWTSYFWISRGEEIQYEILESEIEKTKMQANNARFYTNRVPWLATEDIKNIPIAHVCSWTEKEKETWLKCYEIRLPVPGNNKTVWIVDYVIGSDELVQREIREERFDLMTDTFYAVSIKAAPFVKTFDSRNFLCEAVEDGRKWSGKDRSDWFKAWSWKKHQLKD